ncbi:DUF4258 domain-containing protein [Streptomyces sp. NPDC091204]|uniref:DUF4258 domain-containing protein n=1 Tax=Streptomyces sp. NPDC091204 TaxID=3155299 RepID=UPI003441A54E
MNTSKRLRLLALGFVTSAVMGISGPAMAATTTAGPPIRGGHEVTNRCYSDAGPSAYDRITRHAHDRMDERGVTEDDVQKVVRLNAKKAVCQQNGNWRYMLGLSNGQELVVIVGLGDGGWNVVTVFWKGEKES